MKHSSPDWYVLAVNDLHIGPDVYQVAVVAEHEVDEEGEETGKVLSIKTYFMPTDLKETVDPAYRIMYYIDEAGLERVRLVVYDCLVEAITYN